MHNAHLLKGQKALDSFVQASYDLENLEPEVCSILATGSTTQIKTILAQIKNIQRVITKLEIAKGGSHNGG